MLIMLAESRSLRRKLVRHPVDAGLDSVLQIRSSIEQWPCSSKVREFLLLCWISILEKVGSYFKEGKGIKYRSNKRMPGKYEARQGWEWQCTRFGTDQRKFVLQTFYDQLSMMQADTSVWKG